MPTVRPTIDTATGLYRIAAAVAAAGADGDLDLRLATDLVRHGLADPELNDHPVVPGPAAGPERDQRIGADLARHRAADRIDLTAATATLTALANRLGPAGPDLLDALVTRAVDPLAGLRTVPASALFTPDEEAVIDGLVRSDRPAGELVVTADTGYQGYAMAILKVTRLCNLRCRYCHDWRAGPGNTMSGEVLARTIHGFLTDPATAHLEVTLHGGEPTLIGRRGLLRLLWLQARFLRPGQTVRTGFQTNGHRVDDGILALAARYGLRLGVSLDLDAARHDANRPDVGGRPTFASALDTAARARRLGVLGGVIVVVDEALIDRGAAVLHRELAALGIDDVALLVERPDNDPASGDRLLPRERWGRFLLDLDAELRADDHPYTVRELRSLIEAVNGREATYCEHRGGCVGAFYVVDVDGTIGHCDRFVDVDRFNRFGSAGVGPGRLGASLPVRVLARAEAEARRSRSSCRWSGVCRGWCPHERHLADAYGAARSDGCCGLDELIAGLAAREGVVTPVAGASIGATD